MKDVFGMEYKMDMSTDYSAKINTFVEGLAQIKDEQILCSYENSKENFIFQLALDILKKSKACQLYLQAKYFKIYVDEYQDCDKDMHALFMYICDEFHSSKGLEFEQVIMFVSDYRLSSEQDIYNHYVAVTRAKSKLIMVYINDDWNARQFAKNINKILAESNLKMSDVTTVVNCLGCN